MPHEGNVQKRIKQEEYAKIESSEGSATGLEKRGEDLEVFNLCARNGVFRRKWETEERTGQGCEGTTAVTVI